MRNSVCVLWAKTGFNKHGENTFATAVEVPCRWEDRRTEMVDAEGNKVIVSSVVYIDREVALGSILKHIALASLDSGQDTSDDPERIQDANSVKIMQKIPNNDHSVTMYIAGL